MMSALIPQSESFGEFPAEPPPPRVAGASRPAEPLDDRSIAAALVRMGVIGSQEKPRCEPLEGGVSSEIWRVDVPGRRLTVVRHGRRPYRRPGKGTRTFLLSA